MKPISAFLLHDTLATTQRLGKARVSLPQEEILSEFVHDIENPAASWNRNTPACKWNDVQCSQNGDIRSIVMGFRGLRGSLRWKYLPSTLSTLQVSNNELSGPVSVEYFPSQLEWVDIHMNHFMGGINLSEIPGSLQAMVLSQNELEGALDLSSLNPGFVSLVAHSNFFFGQLNFCEFPSSMDRLNLAINLFSGMINLDHLPKEMSFLDLSENTNLKSEYQASLLPVKFRKRTLVMWFTFHYAINEESFRHEKTQITSADEQWAERKESYSYTNSHIKKWTRAMI